MAAYAVLKETQSRNSEFRRKIFWRILMTADRLSREASPMLKSAAIFIAVWLHVLPRSTLIVSHSVKATKRQAFQYIQTVTLFFCTQLKIIANSARLWKGSLGFLFFFCTVWGYFCWVNSQSEIKDGSSVTELFVSSWGFRVFGYVAIV